LHQTEIIRIGKRKEAVRLSSQAASTHVLLTDKPLIKALVRKQYTLDT